MRISSIRSVSDGATHRVDLKDDARVGQHFLEDTRQRAFEISHAFVVARARILKRNWSRFAVIPRQRLRQRHHRSRGGFVRQAGQRAAKCGHVFLLARSYRGEQDCELRAVHDPGGESLVRQRCGGVEPCLKELSRGSLSEPVGAEFPRRKSLRHAPRLQSQLCHDSKVAIAAAARGPEQIGLGGRVA